MPFGDLPTDVFSQILAEADPRTLASCALVSQTCRLLTLQVLFHDLSITFVDPEFAAKQHSQTTYDEPIPNREKTLEEILESIDATRRIRKYVRTLSLRISRKVKFDDIRPVDPVTIMKILQHFPRVHHLHTFNVFVASGSRYATDLLQNPVLHSIHIEVGKQPSSGQFSARLKTAHKVLGVLSIFDSIAEVVLDGMKFDEEDQHQDASVRILRNGQVESLRILNGIRLPPILRALTGTATSRLKSFACGELEPSDLLAVNALLRSSAPSLQHLILNITMLDCIIEELTEEQCSLLPSCKNLLSLGMEITIPDIDTPPDEGDCEDFTWQAVSHLLAHPNIQSASSEYTPPYPHLHTVTFWLAFLDSIHLEMSLYHPKSKSAMRTLDAFLSELPNLGRVVFVLKIRGDPELFPIPGDAQHLLETELPRLRAKGMLNFA